MGYGPNLHKTSQIRKAASVRALSHCGTQWVCPENVTLLQLAIWLNLIILVGFTISIYESAIRLLNKIFQLASSCIMRDLHGYTYLLIPKRSINGHTRVIVVEFDFHWDFLTIWCCEIWDSNAFIPSLPFEIAAGGKLHCAIRGLLSRS